MPTPVRYPDINGHRYSWVSIEFGLAGAVTFGIKSLNYKDALTPGVVQGASVVGIGRTRGKYEPSGDLEMYREEFDNLTDRLAPAGSPFGFGEVPFDITVNYEEKAYYKIQTDVILGVRLIGPDASQSEGTDNLSVKCALSIIQPISWNGKYLVSQR